jgi:murein DD-endopeptidase MepM/ murein hydrolase activator NlpD
MPPVRRRRQNHASIIVVPPQRDGTLSFNLPGWAYYLVLGSIPAILVILIGGVLLASWMATQLRGMRDLEAQNHALQEETAKVVELERGLQDFEEFRLRVLDLVGADVRDEIEARAEARLQEAELSIAEASLPEDLFAESSPLANRLGTLPSLWPVEGVISRGFHVEGRSSQIHHGIDIAAPHGTAVRASGAGTVAFAGRDSVFGQLVVIDHGKGVHSLYGHNASLDVGQGDRVKRGQQIALVGSTGESSAPHLHFEVRRGGNAINPRTYLVD